MVANVSNRSYTATWQAALADMRATVHVVQSGYSNPQASKQRSECTLGFRFFGLGFKKFWIVFIFRLPGQIFTDLLGVLLKASAYP